MTLLLFLAIAIAVVCCCWLAIAAVFIYSFVVLLKRDLYNHALVGAAMSQSQQRARLERFLGWCRAHVPFYRDSEGGDWWPRVTKQDIVRNYPQHFIQGTYERRMVWTTQFATNAWTQMEKSGPPRKMTTAHAIGIFYGVLDGRTFAQVTGGTSGKYFYQWYGLSDLWWGAYTFVRGWVNLGWKPSDRVFLVYFHGANSVKMLEHLPLGISTLVPRFDEKKDISVDTVVEFARRLDSEKPGIIVTFPNTLFRICQIAWEQNISWRHRPACMDLSADFLFTCQYDFIKRFFPDTEVRLSYGAVEFGQLAQQIPGSLYDYRVYGDVAFMENDSDGNLVVTCFTNSTLPIVRYVTEDKGRVVNEADGGQIIKGLVGKQVEGMDYISIDTKINRVNAESGAQIINMRFDPARRKAIATCLDQARAEDAIRAAFAGWQVSVSACARRECPTQDMFMRKVTPVLREWTFSPST